MNTVLDAALGHALKTEGMQLALQFEGEWRDRALLEFRGWIAMQKAMGLKTITVEQFRAVAKNQPTKHFAWGPFPTIACKAGLIAPKWIAPGQQERVRAASPRTHSHEVKVWEIL